MCVIVCVAVCVDVRVAVGTGIVKMPTQQGAEQTVSKQTPAQAHNTLYFNNLMWFKHNPVGVAE